MSRKGLRFSEIFYELLEDIENCDIIVGHNLKYDLNMIEVELDRIKEYDSIDTIYEKKWADTMHMGAKIRGKWPTLIGLHEELFLSKFENAHNALEDVRATLACYIQML